MIPLRSDEYLAELQRDWLASEQMTQIPSYGAYEKRKTYGLSIVGQDSALALCNRRVDPIDKDHISIVKPADTSDESYRAFKSAYLESHESPFQITRYLKQIDTINHKKLKQKYPLGYCLFAIDDKRIIPSSKLEANYELNWNKARIIEITPQEIDIQLPDIVDKKWNNRITNCISGNARYVGSINRAFNLSGLEIITEIIADNEKGIIIALGFK